MKKIVFILSLLACQSTVFAQLGVGTNSPDASAQLDVTASDKGFLAPRIALASATDVTTIASPATGLLIYNTATAGTSPNNVIPGYYYYDGTKWVRFINSQPSATISFNTADPNSGSPTFTPNTTQNSGYIYVSAINSSLWVWNGSAYVSYAAPASTPFSLSGTSTDAGGNKTASIYRSGGIIAGGTSSSAMYGNLTAVGGSDFSGAIPSGTASIGMITNSAAGWNGPGFLFGNATSGSNAFSLVVNNDKHYNAWLTPANTYNLTSLSNATGWMFGSNMNPGWTPSYALEARGELVSTSNAYFATAGGKVGVNTTSPVSALSNTSLNINNSNLQGVSGSSLTWNHTSVGFASAFYSSNPLAHGLNVKVSGVTSTITAFEVGTATAINTQSTPLFNVLGNGNVGIGTAIPNNKLTVIGNARFTPNTNNNATGEPVTVEIYGRVPTGIWTQVGGLKMSWYSSAAGIEVIRPGAFTGAGLAFNYAIDSATSPTREGFRLMFNGNVGIGSINPGSKLEVYGSATNTFAFNAGSGTSIDFSKSNLAYTTASAGAFTITNIKNGGTYTLAVRGATSGTASFTCSGYTFISVNNGITAPNKHTLYTFIVMGSTVYVYMATGF